MKKIAIFLALQLASGCGANAPAIKHAELACLESDWQSLQAKLASGISSEADAIAFAASLTFGELICATIALGAKQPAAPTIDAGIGDAP